MAMKIMFGDISIYSQMYQGDSNYSALYFTLFYIIIFFVMFSILISLIDGHYVHLMSEEEKDYARYNTRVKYIIYLWKTYYKLKGTDKNKSEHILEKEETIPATSRANNNDQSNEKIELKETAPPFNLNKYTDFEFKTNKRYTQKAIGTHSLSMLNLTGIKINEPMDTMLPSNFKFNSYKAEDENEPIEIKCRNIIIDLEKHIESKLDKANAINAVTTENKGTIQKQTESNSVESIYRIFKPEDNDPIGFPTSNRIYDFINKYCFEGPISIKMYSNIQQSVKESKRITCLLRYADFDCRKQLIITTLDKIKVKYVKANYLERMALFAINCWAAFNYEQYKACFLPSWENESSEKMSYKELKNSFEYSSEMANIVTNYHIELWNILAHLNIERQFWNKLNALCKTRLWNTLAYENQKVIEDLCTNYNDLANLKEGKAKKDKLCRPSDELSSTSNKQCREYLWQISGFTDRRRMVKQQRNSQEEERMRKLIIIEEGTSESTGGFTSSLMVNNIELQFNIKKALLVYLYNLNLREAELKKELEKETKIKQSSIDAISLINYKSKMHKE